MSKVLVTGAAGQVGARLVRQLLARNYEVRGTLLPDDPAAERIAGLEVERAAGDLRDLDFVRRPSRASAPCSTPPTSSARSTLRTT